MRKKVGVDTLRRDNGEKENLNLSQTNIDVKSDPVMSPPVNGNHNDLDDQDNLDKIEKLNDQEPQEDSFEEEEKDEPEETEEPSEDSSQEPFLASSNPVSDHQEENLSKESSSGNDEVPEDIASVSKDITEVITEDLKESNLDCSEDAGENVIDDKVDTLTENTDKPSEQAVNLSETGVVESDTVNKDNDNDNQTEESEVPVLSDQPATPVGLEESSNTYRPRNNDIGDYNGENVDDPDSVDLPDEDMNNSLDDVNPPSPDDNPYDNDLEPPQQPVRYQHLQQGLTNSDDYEPRSVVSDHQPQNLHQSPPNRPHNLHQSPQNQPQNLHQSPAHPSPANLHQSPAHPGPLNLHQSPAHPNPSPTHSDGMPNPFQRAPYNPESGSQSHNSHPGLQNLQYSQYQTTYNHHYFNNANNNAYSGQSTFMPSHGFPHNFSSEARGGMASEQHEMYMNQNRAHESTSHHSSNGPPGGPAGVLGMPGHPGLPGLPGNHQFPRMGGPGHGDPYNYPNSDDDMCSPHRGSGPFNGGMGFSNMPMPLIAPKPTKPRKPRKPRSPKPDGILSMQMREDSRSGDFSDMSFDDDGDGDGKLVIAEGDDLDIKMEGLGEDGKKEKKPRRKHNRFNGMSEEDVMKRLLPDLIEVDLDILIVGINPGLYAAYKQHHYAGPGNHFWKCLFLSGLIPRPMNADNDRELLSIGNGIGFTNIVERTTRASQELTRQEIEEGAKKLIAKIKEYNPKIAVFNGKGIYEVFSGQKEFIFGKQPEKIEDTDTYAWVMPNSSARCAQLPRAIDKVPFYAALKKFRDYLRGDIQELDESEVVFPEVKLQNFNNKRIKREDLNDGEGSMDGEETRIDPETGKKRRGRPPKIRADGSLPPPKRKRVDEYGNPLPKGSNPVDPITGKKKRGRPKKCDMPAPSMGGLSNGLASLARKAAENSAEFLRHEKDSDISGPKPPTRLPPFSPNFARGMGNGPSPGGLPHKEHNSDVPRPDSARLNSSVGDSGAKDLSRSDSLPDLSGRLGDDPCSPPPSPLGKSLPPPEFEPPRSLHEEETSHSSDDRRPDSARSMTRPHRTPQQGCNFSNPTTPVDGHGVQAGYSGPQHRYSPFPGSMKGHQPHRSPNYPTGPGQNFHAPYRSGQIQSTPPHHQNYNDSPQPRPTAKPHDPSDVSTKSLTGLESLVDQIPAIAESDSGVFSGSGNGSHPPTPRSVGPYSPGQYHGGGNYHPPNYPGGGSGQYGGGGQGGPGNTPGSENSYPTDLSTSTNYGGGGGGVSVTTASHSPGTTPSNFSVSNLAHSSVSRGGPPGEENGSDSAIPGHGPPPNVSEAFSVSSLASSYASGSHPSHPGSRPHPGPHQSPESESPKYPPGLSSTNPYMGGISGNHSSMFTPGGLMSRSIGPPNSFMGSSMGRDMRDMRDMSSMAAAGMAGMAGMNAMAGMAGMYGGMANAYGQYSNAAAAGAYGGAAAQAFAAAASGSTYPHGLHMPNPSYPYPSPYSQSPYSQSPYF